MSRPSRTRPRPSPRLALRRALCLALAFAATGPACLPPAPGGVPTTVVLPPANRPGLLFDPADAAAIAARLGRAPYTGWWSTVLSLANAAAAGDPAAPTLSEETRARWAKAAAFAWAVAGDPAHLAAATAALLTVGTGPNALIDDLGPNLGPTSRTVLTASSHLQASALAYDVVRDALTPADRATVEARLAAATDALAASTAADPNNGIFRVNNWRTKTCAALGLAALALPASTVGPSGGTPQTWLDRALRGIDQVHRRTVSGDGWNAEGAWYTSYSFGNLLPFFTAYRRVSGQNLYPAIQGLAHQALLLRQPDGLQPAFEDSVDTELPWHVLAPELAAPGLYHAAWLDVAGAPPRGNYGNNDVKEVDALVLHDDAIAETPYAEPFYVDAASGVARLAAPGASTDTVAWLNGATDYWDFWTGGGHSHVDPLGLLVFAQGEPLLVDSGYGPTGFSSANRAYYTSAEAHNTATLDGLAPWLNAPAAVLAKLDGGPAGALVTMDVVYGTVSSPYGSPIVPVYTPDGRFERTLVVLGRRAVLVHDVVTAAEPRTVALLWHARGARSVVTVGGSLAEVHWSRTRAPLEDTRLRLVATASAPIGIAQPSGFYSGAWNAEETMDYVRLEADGATALRSLALLDLSRTSEAPLAVTPLATSGFEALSFQDGAGDETVLAGDGGAPLAAAGIVANGRLARVRREGGGVAAALLARGTSLAVDGRTLLASSTALTAGIARGGLGWTVVIGGAPTAGGYTLALSLDGVPPSLILWRGSPVSWTLAPDGLTAQLTLAGTGTLEIQGAP